MGSKPKENMCAKLCKAQQAGTARQLELVPRTSCRRVGTNRPTQSRSAGAKLRPNAGHAPEPTLSRCLVVVSLRCRECHALRRKRDALRSFMCKDKLLSQRRGCRFTHCSSLLRFFLI